MKLALEKDQWREEMHHGTVREGRPYPEDKIDIFLQQIISNNTKNNDNGQ